MKIVIINGSARERKHADSNQCIYKRSIRKNEIEIIEPDKLNIAPYARDVVSVNALRDASIRGMIQITTIDKIAAADMILLLHQFIGGECRTIETYH